MSPLSLLGNKAALEFSEMPFPHVIVRNALPTEVYEIISANRPTADEIIGDRTWVQNSRYDLNAHQLLSRPHDAVHPMVRAFTEYHTSVHWYHELLDIFEPRIQKMYPRLCRRVHGKRLRSANTGLRFRDRLDIDLECQFGLNTAVTEQSRVRGPHIDSPVELIGGLYYMRAPDDDSGGGQLQLCVRKARKIMFHGKFEANDDAVDVVKEVPYEPNLFVAFVNHIDSLHSVTPRTITPHNRLLVSIAVEVRSPLFIQPHRQSWLSFWKSAYIGRIRSRRRLRESAI